jgi:hypothetical protein
LAGEIDVLTIPPVSPQEAEREAAIIYDAPRAMIRIPQVGLPRGSIVLVVSHNLPVHESRFALARKHASHPM